MKYQSYDTKDGMNYTAREYVGFSEAFDFFNKELFGGRLPDLLVTLRRGRFRGCYSPDKFVSRDGRSMSSELTLNPDTFAGRSDIEILSTFVHEMVHHQHVHRGTSPQGGYHNKEFSRMMEEVGLHTTQDGTWQGKRTGSSITHLIIPGGPFETAVHKFINDKKYRITWESPGAEPGKKKMDPSKVKFVCGECKNPQALWAKVFSVQICPLCATVFRWADAKGVSDWVDEQVQKGGNFKQEFDAYLSDLSMAESMIEAMWESTECSIS